MAKKKTPAKATLATSVELPVEATSAETPDIYQSTLAISLDKSAFGNRREVSMTKITVDADKALLSASKKLLLDPNLKAINALDAEVVEFIKLKSVPSYFKPGIWLLPKPNVAVVHKYLVGKRAERQKLVDAFIVGYPAAVEKMPEVLKSVFNKADYPSADEMKRLFGFSWRYLNLGAPDELKTLDAVAFEEQNAEISAQMQDAVGEIRNLMVASFAKVVGHMADRLAPGLDGKKKKFHESTLTKLLEFVNNFDNKNDVIQHAELQTLVEQARGLVKGLDVGAIKHSDVIRAQVTEGIAAIQTALEPMVVMAGRAMDLSDDDDVAPRLMTPGQKAAAAKARNKAAASETAAA